MCTEPLAPFVPVFLPGGMFPLFAADHLVNADAGQSAVNDREDDEPLDFGENLGDRGPHGLDTDEAVDAVAAREQLSEVEQPVGNAGTTRR